MLMCIDLYGNIKSIGLQRGRLYIECIDNSFGSLDPYAISAYYLIRIRGNIYVTQEGSLVLDIPRGSYFSYDNGRIYKIN